MRSALILCCAAALVQAQPSAIGSLSWDSSVASSSGSTAPSSTCTFPQFYQQTSNSHVWFCRIGGVAWQDLTSGTLSYVSRSFTYYIDTVNGADANNGTSSATPWKTAANLPSPLAANSSIGLAANSVLHAEIDITVNGVTVGGYGTGAMPLIDASNSISAGAWTKTGGRTSVYQATLTVPASDVPSDPDWYTSAWEDGTRYTIAHSIASVDATASSYYPVSVNSTTITLYVHTSDGSNPGTDGFLMEYAARMYSVLCTDFSTTQGAHGNLYGIRCRRSISANGSINLGRYGTMIDGTAEEGSKHNIFHCGGGVFINVTTLGSYYENIGSTQWIMFDEAPFTGLGADYTDCAALNYGLQDSTAPGWYGHSGSVLDPPFDHVTYTNCYGSLNNLAGQINTLQGSVSTMPVTIYLPGTVLTVRDSQITYDSTSGYGVGSLAADPANNIITVTSTRLTATGTNARAVGCRYSGCVIVLNGDTITGSTGLTNLGAGTNQAGASFAMHNSSAPIGAFAIYAAYAAPTFAVDYNTYTGSTSTAFAQINSTTYTYAQWKGLGYDAHSTP